MLFGIVHQINSGKIKMKTVLKYFATIWHYEHGGPPVQEQWVDENSVNFVDENGEFFVFI